MSIDLRGVAEGAVTAVVPQAAVARVGIKAIMYLVGGVLVIGTVWFLVWWFVIRPGELEDEAAQSKADAAAAHSETTTLEGSQRVTEKFTDTTRIIREITETTNAKILSAPGATDRVNPVIADATVAALCLQPVYSGKPPCTQMQQVRPEAAKGADAGSGHPAP